MTVSFKGAPSHAAYPENGRNPGFAAARLISALPELTDSARYGGLTMATLIGAEIGAKAFGSAAGSAEVWLTLRAWREADMAKLIMSTEEKARAEAASGGVEVSFSFCDVFPATVNDDAALEQLEKICPENGLSCVHLQEPFRWSEDFGYYGSDAKAVIVGIGAGKDSPQLHTEAYVFNDGIIPAALTLFSALAERG
ncbi:MAG: M20/M25/M40 family metallo-hydrolase, partial [Oscillospiraceae bacterium]